MIDPIHEIVSIAVNFLPRYMLSKHTLYNISIKQEILTDGPYVNVCIIMFNGSYFQLYIYVDAIDYQLNYCLPFIALVQKND